MRSSPVTLTLSSLAVFNLDLCRPAAHSSNGYGGPSLFAKHVRGLWAAYRLRVALRSKQLSGSAPVWDDTEPISIEEQRHLLLSEDKHRISPFPYPGLRPFDSEEGEVSFLAGNATLKKSALSSAASASLRCSEAPGPESLHFCVPACFRT